jgi:uncharacterized protein with PIN domain
MRFICDIMLGKLATYLRMAGIDTAYSRSLALPSLIKIASVEQRTILTRRRVLSAADIPVTVYFVNSNDPREQLRDVITHFNITLDETNYFSRCLLCNETLQAIDKSQTHEKVPDYVFSTIDDFSQCPCCKHFYWKGTHYSNMLHKLNVLLHATAEDTEERI